MAIDGIQFCAEYETADGEMCTFVGYAPLTRLRPGHERRDLAEARRAFDDLFVREVVRTNRLYGARVYERRVRFVDLTTEQPRTDWQLDGDWLDKAAREAQRASTGVGGWAAVTHNDVRRAMRRTGRAERVESHG